MKATVLIAEKEGVGMQWSFNYSFFFFKLQHLRSLRKRKCIFRVLMAVSAFWISGKVMSRLFIEDKSCDGGHGVEDSS